MTSAEEGCGEQTVARALLGLLPGTTYHYRLVAITRGWDVAGSDHTFMTMPLPTRVEQKPIQNPNYNPNQNPNQKLFAEEWNDSLSGG